MAKTYYDSRYEQDSITHSYSMGMAAPFDSRVVVDTYEDLYTKSTFKYAELYKGMMVVTLDTNEVYVLVTIPKVNVTSSKWPEAIVWKKVSGEDNINIPENVSAFINDAGYLTGSDVEDFVSTDELSEVLADYASQSDLNLYVKTDDVIDYIEQNGDFVKSDQIKNFIEASDLAEYVSVDSLDEILTEKGLDEFVSQSDLTMYVSTKDLAEELADYVTSSEFDARFAAIDIPEVPTNVSAFTNDAGYLTESDVEDFISVDQLNDVLADYASQSDIKVFVKTDDVIEYIEQNGDFVKSDEIKNFLEASDLRDYVSVDSLDEILTEKGLDDFVSQSDLTLYVSREELTEYVTSSDLDNRLASIEIPENVSAFINDAGYLTESDVEDFISVDQLNNVLADYASQSDLDVYVKTKDVIDYIEQNGDFVKSDEIKNFLEASDVADFITVDQVNEILTEKGVDDFVSQSDLTMYVNRNELVNYVTSSDLDNYAPLESIPTEGMFPADSDVDAEEAVVDGYATVQDVMDYVNALLEKKKDELTEPDYFYVNAVIYTGGTQTLTPIYQMNCIELTDDVNTNEGMVLEVVASSEKYGLDGEGDETIDSFSQVFSIDIMDGYTVDVYARDPMNPSGYSNVKTNLIANPRGATKQYGSRTYNSYIRDVNGDYYENVYGSQVRYKLIIKKSN